LKKNIIKKQMYKRAYHYDDDSSDSSNDETTIRLPSWSSPHASKHASPSKASWATPTMPKWSEEKESDWSCTDNSKTSKWSHTDRSHTDGSWPSSHGYRRHTGASPSKSAWSMGGRTGHVQWAEELDDASSSDEEEGEIRWGMGGGSSCGCGGGAGKSTAWSAPRPSRMSDWSSSKASEWGMSNWSDWSAPTSTTRRRRSTGMTEYRKQPGMSNAGKYTDADGPFCGPKGSKTFPVKDAGHIRSALAYRRNASDPEAVKKCSCDRARELGLNFPSCGVHGRKTPMKRSPKRM
jgi:hypothetical protein